MRQYFWTSGLAYGLSGGKSPSSSLKYKSTQLSSRTTSGGSTNLLILKNQSINQSTEQSINQSIEQSIKQLINQSTNQTIDQSINLSINRTIGKKNQSINQSTDGIIDDWQTGKVIRTEMALMEIESKFIGNEKIECKFVRDFLLTRSWYDVVRESEEKRKK